MSTDVAVESQTEAAPDDAEETPAKPQRPWHSGFCGAGPTCRDGRYVNKAGKKVRYCPYEIRNGEKAARPVLYCACVCHTDPEQAGQAVARP